MDAVNFSELKRNMIQWIDRYVEERELSEFKISGKKRNAQERLPGFENGRKRMIDILVNRNLYRRHLNYPGMMTSLRIEAINKFQANYAPCDITRIFKEVIVEGRKRKSEYDLARIDRESEGFIGAIARHKVKSVICTVAIVASMVTVIVFSWYYRKSH